MRGTFSQEGFHFLAVAVGVVGGTTVAKSDVEIAVGAEQKVAAVVVPGRLLYSRGELPRISDQLGWGLWKP